jgi:hypothetical protein
MKSSQVPFLPLGIAFVSAITFSLYGQFLAFEADLSRSTRVKQKEVKEGHEKASGNQLLRALKWTASFFAIAKTTANPICFIHSMAKPWGDQ